MERYDWLHISTFIVLMFFDCQVFTRVLRCKCLWPFLFPRCWNRFGASCRVTSSTGISGCKTSLSVLGFV